METALRSLLLGNDTGGVIGAELLVPNAARPGAHGIISSFKVDGFETGRVVGSDRGGDQEQKSGSGGSNAEGALGSDHRGAEIEGIALLGGDKTAVDFAEGANEVNHFLAVERG